MKRWWIVPALMVSGSLQAGCLRWDMTARTPAHQMVVSDPQTKPAKAGKAVVLVRPFVDGRPQRHRCGIKKNRQETASVYCESPPNVWLAGMLVDDLRKSGVVVYENVAPPGQETVTVEVVLTQFFVEPEVDFGYHILWPRQEHRPEADLGLMLTARSGTFVAQRRLFVKGLGKHLNGLDSNYQLAIDHAVDRALAAAVAAIIDVINQTIPLAAPCPVSTAVSSSE